MHVVTLCDVLLELLVPRLTPKLEETPLLAAHVWLCSYLQNLDVVSSSRKSAHRW
jgi:hypothetical protein